MAGRLQLPSTWPAQLSSLFAGEVLDLQIDIGSLDDVVYLRGEAVTVLHTTPADVLWAQLCWSRDDGALAASFGQVAIAAGYTSVEDLTADYDESPLTDERWAEVAEALMAVGLN